MYSYRKHTITITSYGVVVHNCNGFVGQFATSNEAEDFIDMILEEV